MNDLHALTNLMNSLPPKRGDKLADDTLRVSITVEYDGRKQRAQLDLASEPFASSIDDRAACLQFAKEQLAILLQSTFANLTPDRIPIAPPPEEPIGLEPTECEPTECEPPKWPTLIRELMMLTDVLNVDVAHGFSTSRILVKAMQGVSLQDIARIIHKHTHDRARLQGDECVYIDGHNVFFTLKTVYPKGEAQEGEADNG